MKTVILLAILLCTTSYVASVCIPRAVRMQMQIWPSREYEYIANIDNTGSPTYLTPTQMISPQLQVMPINGGGIAAGDFYLLDLYSGKRIGFLYNHCDTNPIALSINPSSYLSTFSFNSDNTLKTYIQFPIGTSYQVNPTNQWYCSIVDGTRIGYSVIVTNVSYLPIFGNNLITTALTYQSTPFQTRFIDGAGATYVWDKAAQPICSSAGSNDAFVYVFIGMLFIILGTLFM